MEKNFRTFDKSVTFYRLARALQITGHLRDQLLRAASSIVLNLAEGRGKRTRRDQVRFFTIAQGSLRECQAILTLLDLKPSVPWRVLDSLGASLYLLIKNAR